MATDSEFRSYGYIQTGLADLGWQTKNPSRGGDVYWQQEFYDDDAVLTAALGNRAPENIVCVAYGGGFKYWVIEAKKSAKQLDKARQQAIGYAESINDVSPGSARFATGVAGSPEDTFYVSTRFWDGKKWSEVSINDYETTGFLSPEQCVKFLEHNSPDIEKLDDSPDRFLTKANAINKALHSNEIPVGDRAKTMAALLLAIANDPTLSVSSGAAKLVREINGNIEDILVAHGKPGLADVLKLDLPMTPKNHTKYKRALAQTLQILRDMNIRSAINSGDDALGQFYETFLKYANGAKEMGIVLTPRHITTFAAEVLRIGPADCVYDPTCGTGGFLVAAMDFVKSNAKQRSDWEKFKDQGLFGVEQRDDVYGLAVVNMIFRGDGKSNVYDGNCFDYEFWLGADKVLARDKEQPPSDRAHRPFTKVLMNPPFKLESNSEPEFVDHALRQMEKGGTLFAVLPAVVMSGSQYEQWRQEFLKRHTVKAVIKFDTALFYPVSEATYGLIAKAHQPHKPGKRDIKVFWAELFDGRHTPRPSKMKDKSNAEDNVDEIKKELRRFLSGKGCKESIDNALRVEPLGDSTDLSPELRLPRPIPSVHPNVKERKANMDVAVKLASNVSKSPDGATSLKIFELKRFVAASIKAPLSDIKTLPRGGTPVVSATYYNNGIAKWCEVPDEQTLQRCITISKTHNTRPCEAFWHPYEFSAIPTAIVFKPTDDIANNEDAILYLCEAITRDNQSNYHYAKTVKLEELTVILPAKRNGAPDIEAMAEAVIKQTI